MYRRLKRALVPADRIAIIAVYGIGLSAAAWVEFAWVDAVMSGRIPSVLDLTSPASAEAILRLSAIVLILIGTLIVQLLYSRQMKDAAQLAASEARYRTLFEHSPEGITVTDPDGQYLAVNETACALFGYTHDELISMKASDMVDPALSPAVATMLQDITTGPSYFRMLQFRRKDGSLFDGELSATTMPDGSLLGTIHDVTDREKLEQELRDALAATIDVIGGLSEMRDPYTAGHQRRVSELACAIATDMGMSASDIEDIRVASLMHDVGKMSIPAEILAKPSALSPIELTLVRGHAEASYDVIVAANMGGSIAELVYQHHERCDGTGYPRGLAADAMLMGSKVIMVSDVVEAMVSHRPYRAGLGSDAAVAELRRGAGTVYDADVCASCIRLLTEERFEFPPAHLVPA